MWPSLEILLAWQHSELLTSRRSRRLSATDKADIKEGKFGFVGKKSNNKPNLTFIFLNYHYLISSFPFVIFLGRTSQKGHLQRAMCSEELAAAVQPVWTSEARVDGPE